MTEKQKRFCDEYLIDLNATQAAIRAGYAEKRASEQAYQLLQKTTVNEYLSARMAEKKSDLIATQDEVLEFLTAVMRGEEKDERMVQNADGEYVDVGRRRQANQLQAAEMLAKRYGLLIEKVDADVDMNLNISVDYGGAE